MKSFALTLVLVLAGVAAHAQDLRTATLRVTIAPYLIPTNGSDAVVTVYKSTWLGKTNTPWKKTAIFPASRTNAFIQVVAPGNYFFRTTATVAPYGESLPSNTTTNVLK